MFQQDNSRPHIEAARTMMSCLGHQNYQTSNPIPYIWSEINWTANTNQKKTNHSGRSLTSLTGVKQRSMDTKSRSRRTFYGH